MLNFTFQNPTKIIFGKDTEQKLGAETRKYGTKALLHYGGGSVKKIGLYDKCVKSLKDAGIEITELSGVVPNPRLDLVQEGIRIVREKNIDIIIALGGGSVIDSAKAIAMGVHYDGDVWDFYCGTATPKSAMPVGAVLTIPAAGSESSNSSVITRQDEGEPVRKYGCTDNVIYPVFAILNPEVTYSLPKEQIAYGAADILAHLMERYFVNVETVDLSDRLIEGSMQTLIKYTPLAIANPTNYDIRAEVMWVGTVAHNNLLDQGRGGDWSSHRIEHELSAMFDIAHGAGLAIVFPAWLKNALRTNPKKILQMGERVFGVNTAEKAIEALENFFKSIGLATRLSELQIMPDSFEKMADGAMDGEQSFGTYVKLEKADVMRIFEYAK
jgi:alcohol dehydrogenase YqhD (iron-dependent ADH family)